MRGRRPDAVDLAIARILLGHAIVFGWGGIPVLWMGDELALRNDPDWADEPAHADDNRWVHRPTMPWERRPPASHAGDDRAAGVRWARRTWPRTRAGLPHLHASVRTEPLDPTDPGVFAVRAAPPVGPLLALYNVTDTDRPFPAWRVDEVGLESRAVVDALTGKIPPIDEHGNYRLAPYAAVVAGGRHVLSVIASPEGAQTPARHHGQNGVLHVTSYWTAARSPMWGAMRSAMMARWSGWSR